MTIYLTQNVNIMLLMQSVKLDFLLVLKIGQRLYGYLASKTDRGMVVSNAPSRPVAFGYWHLCCSTFLTCGRLLTYRKFHVSLLKSWLNYNYNFNQDFDLQT